MLRQGRRSWMLREGLFGAFVALVLVLVTSLADAPGSGSRSPTGITVRLAFALAVCVPVALRVAAHRWKQWTRPTMEGWKAGERQAVEE